MNATTTTTASAPERKYRTIVEDDGNWHIGKPCLKAIARYEDGTEMLLGTVIFDYDRQAQKTIYRATYPDGTELAPPSERLRDVKRIFFDRSAEIIKEIEARQEAKDLDPVLTRTEAVVSPYHTQSVARNKAIDQTRGRKGKSQRKTRGR